MVLAAESERENIEWRQAIQHSIDAFRDGSMSMPPTPRLSLSSDVLTIAPEDAVIELKFQAELMRERENVAALNATISKLQQEKQVLKKNLRESQSDTLFWKNAFFAIQNMIEAFAITESALKSKDDEIALVVLQLGEVFCWSVLFVKPSFLFGQARNTIQEMSRASYREREEQKARRDAELARAEIAKHDSWVEIASDSFLFLAPYSCMLRQTRLL